MQRALAALFHARPRADQAQKCLRQYRIPLPASRQEPSGMQTDLKDPLHPLHFDLIRLRSHSPLENGVEVFKRPLVQVGFFPQANRPLADARVLLLTRSAILPWRATLPGRGTADFPTASSEVHFGVSI